MYLTSPTHGLSVNDLLKSVHVVLCRTNHGRRGEETEEDPVRGSEEKKKSEKSSKSPDKRSSQSGFCFLKK